MINYNWFQNVNIDSVAELLYVTYVNEVRKNQDLDFISINRLCEEDSTYQENLDVFKVVAKRALMEAYVLVEASLGEISGIVENIRKGLPQE